MMHRASNVSHFLRNCSPTIYPSITALRRLPSVHGLESGTGGACTRQATTSAVDDGKRRSGGGTQSHITSVANPLVKHLVQLRNKPSYRIEQGAVVVPGLASVREVIEASPSTRIRSLLIQEGLESTLTNEAFRRVAERQGTDIVLVSESVMRKVSGLENVEGMAVIAELDRPGPSNFLASTSAPSGAGKGASAAVKLRRLLALEGIQDPGNVGTLLRTAVAFGWDGVFLLPGCCDLFNDKAIRASKGACFQLPWAQGTWADLTAISERHRLPFVAAEPEPPSTPPLPSAARKREAVCLVLGAEGKGLSEEALRRCSPVSIPMPGGMESLNVGVAGGILMFYLSPALDQLGQRFAEDGTRTAPLAKK